jgi:hypothetical protein
MPCGAKGGDAPALRAAEESDKTVFVKAAGELDGAIFPSIPTVTIRGGTTELAACASTGAGDVGTNAASELCTECSPLFERSALTSERACSSRTVSTSRLC